MPSFSVERLSFTALTELPGSWKNQDYRELLTKMNYDNPDGIAEAELRDMCLMSFTDLEPREAAEIVLDHLLGEQLTAGQRENLAHQMLTEKLWEENPELPLHRAFYQATELLHTAYNGTFPRAQAVQFRVRCTAADPADAALLLAPDPAAPLLRLLAQGLPENALLNRLYGEQLAGPTFEEARSILWQLTPEEPTATSVVFDVVGSTNWLEEFKYANAYEASTHADDVPAAAE